MHGAVSEEDRRGAYSEIWAGDFNIRLWSLKVNRRGGAVRDRKSAVLEQVARARGMTTINPDLIPTRFQRQEDGVFPVSIPFLHFPLSRELAVFLH